MADSIVDGTNIDTSIFSYSKPKVHESGGKVVNLYNKHFKESLTISTPLILTWGAQEGQEQGTKKPTGKFTMSLQFPTPDYTNPDLDGFLKSMKALEDQVKRDAMANSLEWFGKEYKSMDVIDEKFNVMLRHPKIKGTERLDLDKPPTLTVKIPCWNGVWKPEIYDEEGEPLFVNGKVNSHLTPLEYLKPKTHVICLIQCGGLWFVNGKVSITWNLKQAIVQKPKASMEGKCFLKPKAEDKEKLKTLPSGDSDVEDGHTATLVSDSDDDDDDAHSSHSVPVPPPAPAPVPVPPPAPVPTPAPVVEVEAEVKPKAKKIVAKKPKTDA
jgi:hypothetical protein